MIHLGDITRIQGSEVPVVDIVTGGSPCQDLSVAGKRAGLAGERSGLFMEQIRIIKEMRENDRTNGRTDEHIRPRYMVWENVPGAFSSNNGEDFHAVLEETAKVAERDARIPGFTGGKWPAAGCIMGNGWSLAWRVHDAQFWGVPQRRKRIALVADFGGSTAPEILFERKGVPRDIEQGTAQGEAVATDFAGCPEASSYTLKIRGGREIDSHGKKAGKGPLVQAELSATLGVSQDQTLIALTTEMTPKIDESGTAFSLRSRDYKDPQSVVYGISAFDSNAMKSDNPNSGVYEADTARTLDNNGGNPACNQGGMAVVEPILLESNQNHATIQTDGISTALPASAGMGGGYVPMVCIEGNGSRESHRGNGFVESDIMYTLNSTEHHAICIENHPADSRVKIAEDGKVQTLSSRMGTGGNVPLVMESSAWDGTQVSPTLTANNAGGGQRMPDKDNFNAVIQGINGDVAGTLDASYYKGCGERQGIERDVVAYSLDAYNQTTAEEVTQPIRSQKADADHVPVTYGLDRAAYNQGQNAKFNFSVDEEKVGALVAKGPGGFFQAVVRRLTPLECERLQGFPDNWTNIGEWIDSKGKKHKDADSPRYKALGNSIALPFWQWMAARMVKYIDHEPTMASLFDGIGGFPLVFSRVGCKPVWASEIEEFPIAVTKIRFQEEK